MDTLTASTLLDTAPLGWLGAPFLWAAQCLVGGAVVAGNVTLAALVRTGRIDGSRITAAGGLSRQMHAFLWVTHVAGGLGLVLPQVTGVLPWLTPIAGFALAVQAFMASGFHLRAQEEALEPGLFGALFGVVALGRIDLLGFSSPIPPAAIGLTILVLAVALTVNLTLLLRGPRNPFRRQAPADPSVPRRPSRP